MITGCDRRRRRRAFLVLGLALALAGCAAAGNGSSTPGGYTTSDPYHYRCTGNCQAGA